MVAEIRQCRAWEIFEDPRGPELIEQYAAECANQAVGTPAPSESRYADLESAGSGQCFAVRNESELVGFAFVIAAVVPHYELACATVESIFVRDGAPGGTQLMAALEAWAKERGAMTLFYVAPVGSRFARRLFLSSEAYKHTNHVFCRSVAT